MAVLLGGRRCGRPDLLLGHLVMAVKSRVCRVCGDLACYGTPVFGWVNGEQVQGEWWYCREHDPISIAQRAEQARIKAWRAERQQERVTDG